MAGKSSNNRKRQTGSSSRKGSNSRKQTIDEPILNPDIVLFLTIALGIFLELCNFHVIGPVGEVISSVMFGLGGVMAYLLPVALVAIVFFGYLSRESRVIKVKFITGICLFVLVLIFVEEVFGCVRDMETLSVADIWSNGSEMRHGGGVIAGLIAFFMHKYMGMAGTLLVVIVLMLVCIMLLMGRERISSLKQNGREAYASAREERERRRLEYEEEMREYEESNRAKDSTPRNGSASATDAEENLPRYARKRRGVASSVLNNEDDKPVGEEYKEIEIKDNIPRRNRKVSGVMMDTTIENRKPAVRNDIHEITVKNTDRSLGTIFGSEITKRYQDTLEDDTFVVNCTGSGGQSFGAFIPKGLTLNLTGDSNDYFGKGLSGGKLTLTAPKNVKFKPHENIIVGNVALYGATSGKAFINGVAGERFCVRNSGALAVVEGVGDHGCEYMTGGRVVILGDTGKNFAAGMSGGIAYVLDEKSDFYTRVNKELVSLEPVTSKYDVQELKEMITEHVEATGSEMGKKVLDNFVDYLPKFKKVLPHDYSKMQTAIAHMEEKGLSVDQAQIEAFYANKRG